MRIRIAGTIAIKPLGIASIASLTVITRRATRKIIAKIRAMKHHKQAAVFLFIEDLGSAEMLQAKRWAELWGVKIFFGTIDKGIPAEWVQ